MNTGYVIEKLQISNLDREVLLRRIIDLFTYKEICYKINNCNYVINIADYNPIGIWTSTDIVSLNQDSNVKFTVLFKDKNDDQDLNSAYGLNLNGFHDRVDFCDDLDLGQKFTIEGWIKPNSLPRLAKGALEFDGQTTWAESDSINLEEQFTIEAWVKFNENTADLPGKALLFDGEDDFLIVNEQDGLTPIDELTIEAWINPSISNIHPDNVVRFNGQETVVELANGNNANTILGEQFTVDLWVKPEIPMPLEAGNALYFDGNGYGEVLNATGTKYIGEKQSNDSPLTLIDENPTDFKKLLYTSDGITIDCWFKLDTDALNNGPNYIISKPGHYYVCIKDLTTIQVGIFPENSSISFDSYMYCKDFVLSLSTINDNTWYYIVINLKANPSYESSARLFDEQLEISLNSPIDAQTLCPINQGNRPLLIGTDNGIPKPEVDNKNFFKGWIKTLKIYHDRPTGSWTNTSILNRNSAIDSNILNQKVGIDFKVEPNWNATWNYNDYGYNQNIANPYTIQFLDQVGSNHAKFASLNNIWANECWDSGSVKLGSELTHQSGQTFFGQAINTKEYNYIYNFLYLDDSEDIKIPFDTQKFTIQIYIKPDWLNMPSDCIWDIFCKRIYSPGEEHSSANNEYRIRFEDNHTLRFSIVVGGIIRYVDVDFVSSVYKFASDPVDSDHLLITAIYDNGNMSLHVSKDSFTYNDRDYNINPYPTKLDSNQDNTYPLIIGGANRNVGLFNGYIDELRLWNYQFNNDDVLEYYNNGKGKLGILDRDKNKNLIAGWHFDEEGTICYPFSSNNDIIYLKPKTDIYSVFATNPRGIISNFYQFNYPDKVGQTCYAANVEKLKFRVNLLENGTISFKARNLYEYKISNLGYPLIDGEKVQLYISCYLYLPSIPKDYPLTIDPDSGLPANPQYARYQFPISGSGDIYYKKLPLFNINNTLGGNNGIYWIHDPALTDWSGKNFDPDHTEDIYTIYQRITKYSIYQNYAFNLGFFFTQDITVAETKFADLTLTIAADPDDDWSDINKVPYYLKNDLPSNFYPPGTTFSDWIYNENLDDTNNMLFYDESFDYKYGFNSPLTIMPQHTPWNTLDKKGRGFYYYYIDDQYTLERDKWHFIELIFDNPTNNTNRYFKFRINGSPVTKFEQWWTRAMTWNRSGPTINVNNPWNLSQTKKCKTPYYPGSKQYFDSTDPEILLDPISPKFKIGDQNYPYSFPKQKVIFPEQFNSSSGIWGIGSGLVAYIDKIQVRREPINQTNSIILNCDFDDPFVLNESSKIISLQDSYKKYITRIIDSSSNHLFGITGHYSDARKNNVNSGKRGVGKVLNCKNQIILYKGLNINDDLQSSFYVSLMNVDGESKIVCFVGDSQNTFKQYFNTNITPFNWNYIGVSYQNIPPNYQGFKVYTNGILQNEFFTKILSQVIIPYNFNNKIYIGAAPVYNDYNQEDNYIYHFTGVVDRIKLYSLSLYLQFDYLYNSGKGRSSYLDKTGRYNLYDSYAIASWSLQLDEDNIIKDLSNKGNDGYVLPQNLKFRTSFGKLEYGAIIYDNNSYAIVENKNVLNLSSNNNEPNFTIICWINPTKLDITDSDSGIHQYTILSKFEETVGRIGSSGWRLYIQPNLEFDPNDSSNLEKNYGVVFEIVDSYGNINSYICGNFVIDGFWHHIAVKLDRSIPISQSFSTSLQNTDNRIDMFYDGVRYQTYKLSIQPSFGCISFSNPIVGGEKRYIQSAKYPQPFNLTNRFKGYIDEVKIYNSALSYSDILEDYCNGRGNKLCFQDYIGNLLYWPMNEQSTYPYLVSIGNFQIDALIPGITQVVSGFPYYLYKSYTILSKYEVNLFDQQSYRFMISSDVNSVLRFYSTAVNGNKFCEYYSDYIDDYVLNDEWIYAVTTYKKSEGWKFFINGIEINRFLSYGSVDPLSDPISIQDCDTSILIGSSSDYKFNSNICTTDYFKGKMDNLFFYHRALSLSEIQQHYNNGKGICGNPYDNQLKLGFRFDEGKGLNTYGCSINNEFAIMNPLNLNEVFSGPYYDTVNKNVSFNGINNYIKYDNISSITDKITIQTQLDIKSSNSPRAIKFNGNTYGYAIDSEKIYFSGTKGFSILGWINFGNTDKCLSFDGNQKIVFNNYNGPQGNNSLIIGFQLSDIANGIYTIYKNGNGKPYQTFDIIIEKSSDLKIKVNFDRTSENYIFETSSINPIPDGWLNIVIYFYPDQDDILYAVINGVKYSFNFPPVFDISKIDIKSNGSLILLDKIISKIGTIICVDGSIFNSIGILKEENLFPSIFDNYYRKIDKCYFVLHCREGNDTLLQDYSLNNYYVNIVSSNDYEMWIKFLDDRKEIPFSIISRGIPFDFDGCCDKDISNFNVYVFKEVKPDYSSNYYQIGLRIADTVFATYLSGISPSAWNHVAITFQYSENKEFLGCDIYINGKKQKLYNPVEFEEYTEAQHKQVSNYIGTGYPFYIAGMNIGAENKATTYFSGFIDELKIYSKKFTIEEVLYDYNNGQGRYGAPYECDLIAGYHFDEYVIYNITEDFSINNFDLNLISSDISIPNISSVGIVNDLENNKTILSQYLEDIVPQQYTQSLLFNGYNDYVYFDDNRLNLKNIDFTISTWIYKDASQDHLVNPIIYKSSKLQNSYFGLYNLSLLGNDVILFYLQKDDGSYIVLDLGQITNSWTNIIIVKGNGKLTGYINAVKRDEINFIGNISDSNSGLIFGRGIIIDEYRSFKGKISETRFYNKVLNENEIQKIFIEKIPGKIEDGLIAGWHFINHGYSRLSDYGNNNIDGIINGAVFDDDTPLITSAVISNSGGFKLQLINSCISAFIGDNIGNKCEYIAALNPLEGNHIIEVTYDKNRNSRNRWTITIDNLMAQVSVISDDPVQINNNNLNLLIGADYGDSQNILKDFYKGNMFYIKIYNFDSANNNYLIKTFDFTNQKETESYDLLFYTPNFPPEWIDGKIYNSTTYTILNHVIPKFGGYNFEVTNIDGIRSLRLSVLEELLSCSSRTIDNSLFNDNVWYHVVVRYNINNNPKIDLFINGVIQSTNIESDQSVIPKFSSMNTFFGAKNYKVSLEQTYSLLFDGIDDSISIDNFYNLIQDFTLFTWIKILKTEYDPLQAIHVPIIWRPSIYGNNKPVYSLEIIHLNNQNYLLFYVHFNNNTSAYITMSIESLSFNEWTNIAAVRSNNILKLYVNGQLKSQNDIVSTLPLANENGNLLLGSGIPTIGGSAKTFLGNMTETRIYNIALDENTLYSYYLERKLGVPENNLIAGWHFEMESDITNIRDYSGNNYIGQVNGAQFTIDSPIAPYVANIDPNRIRDVFHGKIDELKLTNSYMSNIEIQNNYNLGNGIYGQPYLNNPVAGYHFDKSNNNITPDYTDNLYDITLHGAFISEGLISHNEKFDIISKWEDNSSNKSYKLSLQYNNSNVYLVASVFNGSLNEEWVLYQQPINAWTHLLVTYDNTRIKDFNIYINGAIMPTYSSTDLHLIPSSNLVPTIIGASSTSIGHINFYDGCVDEFKIYSRVLSEHEIELTYNSGIGLYGNPDENDIIAGWHFDENTGLNTYDFVNSCDGILNRELWNKGHVRIRHFINNYNTGMPFCEFNCNQYSWNGPGNEYLGEDNPFLNMHKLQSLNNSLYVGLGISFSNTGYIDLRVFSLDDIYNDSDALKYFNIARDILLSYFQYGEYIKGN